MNYGLYLSASGTLTNLARMDVISNNLANAQTPGFRADQYVSQARLPERLEDPGLAAMAEADPQMLLERLGGGVLMGRPRLSSAQGPIETTGRDLDLAVKGDGFFTVSAPGADGKSTTRYTRDGRFTIDAEGHVVTSVGGHKLLDDQQRAIRVERGQPVTIQPDGRIMQGAGEVGRIALADPDLELLIKLGDSLHAYDAPKPPPASSATLISGALEGSGVDPIAALTDMMETSRNVNTNTRLMQYHDKLMELAVNRLGRIV